MTDPADQARLARLQEIREGMEALRIEALAERGGRTFTTEETLEFIRRHDLAADTMARRAPEGLEPEPAVLGSPQSYVDADVTIDELIAGEAARQHGVISPGGLPLLMTPDPTSAESRGFRAHLSGLRLSCLLRWLPVHAR